jgi:thimet oligopeptidase
MILLAISLVKTLFHEFGHAVHALLGRAEMPRKGAYNTTMDFIETPSQLFEEWAWDHDILKRISCHYQTGEPLPDGLIHRLAASREYEEGRRVIRELQLAQISLNCFMPGKNKDLILMGKKIHEDLITAVAHDPESHSLCSFSHLVGYGAKYYSYLWSKELAMKFFDYIRSHGGLSDPAIGQCYREKVISKGGSCDPEVLVRDFLCNEENP